MDIWARWSLYYPIFKSLFAFANDIDEDNQMLQTLLEDLRSQCKCFNS